MNNQEVYDDSHWDRGCSIDNLSKEEIYHMLYHDAVTGYYNWNHMWHILDSRHFKDYKYCFVHFDIKDFKIINIEKIANGLEISLEELFKGI